MNHCGSVPAEGTSMAQWRETPPKAWRPMTDEEWLALLPHLFHRVGPGRPLREQRERMDAIFWMAAARGQPWRVLPDRFGRADTVHRYFRRLTHRGIWQVLLQRLAEEEVPAALRSLAPWILRACRRATRILGLPIVALVRRLGFLSALRGPPHLVPDPDLSEILRQVPVTLALVAEQARPRAGPAARRWRNPVIVLLDWVHRRAGGAASIPRRLEPA